MRLYLIQHGEALPKEIDEQRPLSEAGRAGVSRVAELLRQAGIKAPTIYHSGKLRAQQTAEILAPEQDAAIHAWSGLGPKDPVLPLITALQERGTDLALVGHQPWLGKAATMLLSSREDPPQVVFEPGSVLCLQRDQEGWAVLWMIRPSLLPRADALGLGTA